MDNAENRVLVSGLELEETQVKQREREREERRSFRFSWAREEHAGACDGEPLFLGCEVDGELLAGDGFRFRGCILLSFVICRLFL